MNATRLLLTIGLVATLVTTADVGPARASQTEPVYSYANALRESVWVTTPLDNDGDGKLDRVAVDLIRPREAADTGVKVPVIMVASPYFKSAGRGNEGERKQYDAAGTITKFPLYYDNYFVPRGYAVAHVDLAGTNRSTGCVDVGGREEVLSVKAAIDWLNGRASAEYRNGAPATAGWSTGKVGMIGKSWDGTLANGVAATGVDGLATIVPISAISSWYDYVRLDGVLRSPDDPAWLHSYVNGRARGVCAAVVARLRAGADDATGNYNAFWSERDYVPAAGMVRASVFVVHGQGDLNVKTSQFGKWWSSLGGVPRKLWLAQSGHVDPFDFRRTAWVDTLHRWFDYWLRGVPNGIMTEPAVSIERGPGQWTDEPAWPAAAAQPLRLRLRPGNGTTGTLEPGAPGPNVVHAFTDNPGLTEGGAVTSPNTAKSGRLVFLSAPLPEAARYSGTPALTLRVRVNKPTTELTARLVDYGSATRVNYLSRGEGIRNLTTESCWGSSTAADDACYIDTAPVVATRDLNVFTRGWIDAAHYQSLSQRTPLQPERWYVVTVPVHATDAVLASGHVLGLVVTASDTELSTPASTGARVEVDLGASSLLLPTTEPASVTAAGGVPPRVSGRDRPGVPRAGLRQFR